MSDREMTLLFLGIVLGVYLSLLIQMLTAIRDDRRIRRLANQADQAAKGE